MYWDESSSVLSSLLLDTRIAAYLRPGDRVLDIGCGAGRIMGELAGQGFRVVGADRNAASLARAGGRGLAVVRADAAALPFGTGCFDAAVLHAVLTVLPTPQSRHAVLTEARRLGCRLLCIADFLQNWDLPLYKARYEAGQAETGERGSFVVRQAGEVLYLAHHFTLGELTGLLAGAGYAVALADTPLVTTRSGNRVRGLAVAALAEH
ncbi:MAG: class I SAM-dependent methyltransferase [Solidesulfovibrio sp. DCME]|uniref:class I SAM-dependent methyltransferase n=1 Tax=Solidesulfovibrio sp. DCME TaxID=3447380 RepID=UPI003D0FFB5D